MHHSNTYTNLYPPQYNHSNHAYQPQTQNSHQAESQNSMYSPHSQNSFHGDSASQKQNASQNSYSYSPSEQGTFNYEAHFFAERARLEENTTTEYGANFSCATPINTPLPPVNTTPLCPTPLRPIDTNCTVSRSNSMPHSYGSMSENFPLQTPINRCNSDEPPRFSQLCAAPSQKRFLQTCTTSDKGPDEVCFNFIIKKKIF